VSTDAQAEDGQSLEVQRRQLEGWAMQRGQPLDQVVVEAGVSGAVPFYERPEGGRPWELVQKGDTVVAAKLDRMFRSAADCLTVVEAFKACGASLFLLDLNGERIRQTKRQQKARGVYLGGPPPFGWAHDAERRLVPVPEQQNAIRRIQKLAAEGLSLYKISDDLKVWRRLTQHPLRPSDPIDQPALGFRQLRER
jgi:putative DNA-invertase from lambdoid prophage Rac